MADISFTATAVVANASGANQFLDAVWGGSVTGGMPVYQHTDGKFYGALNDTAAHAAVVGFALSAGAAGQRGQIQTSGLMTLGSGMTAGVAYYCSANAGGIAPVADLGSGKYVTVLGVAKSSSVLQIGLIVSATAL